MSTVSLFLHPHSLVMVGPDTPLRWRSVTHPPPRSVEPRLLLLDPRLLPDGLHDVVEPPEAEPGLLGASGEEEG